MSQLEKMVERAVRSVVEEVVRDARRKDRDELEGLRHRVGELEKLEQQNAERIRGLERVEDHRNDYLPPDAVQRLEAHLARLRGIK